MENATKALLIAAAILIAIIIISIGIAVVRQGSEAVGNADMTEAETTQFNLKFTQYENTRASVDEVNALLAAVVSHNTTERAEGTERTVRVTGDVTLAATATRYTRETGAGNYTIQCELSADTGLVNRIRITEN